MSGVTGNFSAAAGFATPSYRVNADGSVEFKGALTAAATASGSVLQAGLPAPGATRNLHGYIADYPSLGYVDTGGNLKVSIAAGATLHFDEKRYTL